MTTNTVSAADHIIYVNGSSGNDSWDGSSWAKPKLSIKNATGTVKPNGHITIANGQYTGENNTNIYIQKNMTITGQSQTKTIINGNDSAQMFMIMGGVTVTIQNLTFTHGTSDNGGAIYNDGGNLIVKKCTFQNNRAEYDDEVYGGAIFNDHGNLTVNNSFFENNIVHANSDCFGGAIGSYYGNLTVTNSSFENNEAEHFTGFGGGHGGAIGSYYGDLNIINCTLNNNSADYIGGAVYKSHGNLTIMDSVINYNNVNSYNYGYGGAIYNVYSNLTVTNSTINYNKAYGTIGSDGGAIYNYKANSTFKNCTINKNNVGMDGGAIYSYDSSLTLTKCMINNNNNDGLGGAIYCQEGNLTVTMSMLSNNTAVAGGAIYCYKVDVKVTNCTLNNNTADYGGVIYNRLSVLRVTECIINNNMAKVNGGAFENLGISTLHFNRIVGNSAEAGSAIYNWISSLNPMSISFIDATNNWWGFNNDPKTISNLIVVSNGTVYVDKWVILTVDANPNTINNTKTSTVTADLNHNNNGKILVGGQIPNGPITLKISWGSFKNHAIAHTVTKTTKGAITSATYYANQGQAPENPVKVTASADGYTTKNSESAYIRINPASNMYMQITSEKIPYVDETFILTYKLGNRGPDTANNVKVTIPIPDGFHIALITGDGAWNYNTNIRTITWTLNKVEIGDPYLYIMGWFTKPGSYVFSSSISSDTHNINSQSVTPLNLSTTEVKAATKTIGMQNTGTPINYLITAVLMVISCFILPKRK